MNKVLAVIGGANPGTQEQAVAYKVGRMAAQYGYVVATGGLGGVMTAASQGAHDAGGLVLGIIPSADKAMANPYVDIVIATGMGHARNIVLVQSADLVVAVGGSYGTLSEMAIAMKTGRTVLGLGSWTIKGVTLLKDVTELKDYL